MNCRVEITRLSRIILATDAVRNLALGFVLVAFPALWDTISYNFLDSYFPLHYFGWAFVASGLYCLYASVRQGAHTPRRAFQASAIVLTVWLAVFIATFIFENPTVIRTIIPYAALLAIDFAFIATSVERNDQR